ncbi:WD40 repeat-like protein, partial [Pholiota conissans]
TSPPRKRSLSPAQRRKKALALSLNPPPRSFTVEAVCAIPHPVPTHALAASACMTHLLTGSDDGYVRDYDIFAAVNSKNFLTAPQRHHAGVVEGLMKSGQLRFWWENPTLHDTNRPGILSVEEESGLAPVYSLAMQSDALWALAGTDAGYINLFTLRHEPGKLCHVMNTQSRSPISALCLDYDEKGFFSAGWDGVAIQWDLNTGQNVRNFTAHHAQLTSISLRPAAPYYTSPTGPIHTSSQARRSFNQIQSELNGVAGSPGTGDEPSFEMNLIKSETVQAVNMESDARSDASFDPLFDDVSEDMMQTPAPTESKLAMPGSSNVHQPVMPRELISSTIPPPKGAPPLIDVLGYQSYSSDILMTAFIDGQVILWDRRVQNNGRGVGRLWINEKTPPWCLSACWSTDGAQIYAGRRNGSVDVWDVRVLGQSGPTNTPRLLKTLRNPASSGVVSCVVPFPDCRHIACASVDNIRLWNVAENVEDGISKTKSGVQFKIIPGHHGGYISQMLVDPGARFLVSASSNRGLHGDSTRTVFVHDIKHIH